jgi:hypothetical protein
MTTLDMKREAEKAARTEAEREAREEAAKKAATVTSVRSGDPTQVGAAHVWTVNVTVEMEGGAERKFLCKSADTGKTFVAEKDPHQ